jgi:hypothetical protein
MLREIIKFIATWSTLSLALSGRIGVGDDRLAVRRVIGRSCRRRARAVRRAAEVGAATATGGPDAAADDAVSLHAPALVVATTATASGAVTALPGSPGREPSATATATAN